MNLVDNQNNLIVAVKALKKLHFQKQKKSQFKQLFDDDEENSRSKINLVVSLCKIPKIPSNGKVQPVTVQSNIPHSFVDDLTDVLLITKNLKGFKKEFEHTVNSYEDLLRNHGASNLITQVMAIGQIKYEHCEYESKRALASRFDIVLCDAAIIRLLPRLLGKPFYAKKKRPISINMKAKDLKNEIEKVLSKTYLHMNLEGSSAMAQIGRLNQTDEEIALNIGAFVKSLKSKSNFPGGWKNVRSLHIKTEYSKAIPLYLNTASPLDMPNVKHPNEKKLEFCGGTISTKASRFIRVSKGGDFLSLPKSLGKQTPESLDKLVKNRSKRNASWYSVYDPQKDKVIKGSIAKSERTWSSRRLPDQSKSRESND